MPKGFPLLFFRFLILETLKRTNLCLSESTFLKVVQGDNHNRKLGDAYANTIE